MTVLSVYRRADPTLFVIKSSLAINFPSGIFDTGVMVVDLVIEPYIVFDYYDLSLRRERERERERESEGCALKRPM